MLEYSTVIVTRNRPEALALSLPLILGQSRAPSQTLVIDSSDNPDPSRTVIDRIRAETGIPIQYMTAPKGMTIQRNIGLSHVRHPVVFFPDDDSLLHPGTMQAIMEVYERDTEGLVGGVCSAEAKVPPDGVLKTDSYDISTADRIRKLIIRPRIRIEQALVPDPFHEAGWTFYQTLTKPDWMDGETTKLVEYMTGFRMSFRTELIRANQFDETLGAYALFEDTDACFRILKSHVLVGALKAQIYHHKVPSARDRGFAMGAMQLLNRAYILAKNGRTETKIRRQVKVFHLYKLAQYMLGSGSQFGRDRVAGARAAMAQCDRLLSAPPEQATELYVSIRDELGL